MSSRTTPPRGWTALEYILKQKHTSLNHTTGLNRALDYVDGDYVILTDTDVAIMVPNWDQYLVKEIERRNLDILGMGHWDHPRGYQGFPIVTFFIARSSSYVRANPDFRPNLCEYPNKHGMGAKEIYIKTDREAYIYGKPKGSPILLDSGWRLPGCFKDLNMRGDVFSKIVALKVLDATFTSSSNVVFHSTSSVVCNLL